jgi:NADH-quinone oxidoreductase subunit J
MIQILFFFFAAMTVGAAINVLAQRHVLYSSLSLIVMLTGMSGLFVLLRADFLAVINVIVYAGAIMVLFVFVIMLLNLPHDEDGPDRLRWLKFIGIPMSLFLLLMIIPAEWHIGGLATGAITGGIRELPQAAAGTAPALGSPASIGKRLFTDYVLPFELTSLLILIALMGAVVFAKKDI